MSDDHASSLNNRAYAYKWAGEVVEKLSIARVDAPYMTAVLVEAALMETPLHPLTIAVNHDGTRYLVTITGYTQMLDLVKWTSIFMGAERPQELSRVRGLYVQFPPNQGAYLVIEMEQAHWHDAKEPAGTRKGYRKKRTE